MSLQIWLPLTQETGIQNQGLNGTEFISGNVTLNKTDGMGSCYSCGGSNGYVLSKRKVFLGKKQSVFCWVKLNSFNSSSNLTGICGQHNYHNRTGMGINLIYSSATSGYLGVSTGTGDARTYQDHKGSTLLSAGTWYHVGYTYDGSQIKLYVNGKLDKTINFTGMATPADYFQAFQWSLATNGTCGVQGSYAMNGYLNDVRAYDHVLTLKEIKELAKGLMLHYPFDKDDYDEVRNIFVTPKIGTSARDSGWDVALHARAINVSGWSNGYNGGVSSPAIGYHARWEVINNEPVMVFPKRNHTVSGLSATRWLGISTSTNISTYIKASTTYTVSFEAMADTEGRQIYGGLHYNNGSSTNFHDGSFYAKNIPVGKWKKYTFTFTTQATCSSPAMYFYGTAGTNGIAYVRNPQLEVGATCHGHQTILKSKDDFIYDASGFGYHGKITGALASKQSNVNTNKEGSRNYQNKSYDAYFNGSSYVCYDTEIAIPKTYTIAFWFNKTANEKHVIDWRTRASGNAGIQPVYLNSNGTIQYYTSSAGTTNFNYVFNNNTWYHVAIAVNASSATLYVNGVKQQTVTQSIPATTGAFHVGCRVSYANIATMDMKDLKLYATTLTDADIQSIYQTSFSVQKQGNIYSKELREGYGA